MRLLILNWKDPKNPTSGGAEHVTMIHALSWAEKGHQVDWFSSSFPNANAYEEISGVHIFRKGNYVTVYLFAPFFYFFRRNAYDIVIDEVHGIPFFTPLFVRQKKIAFIHEVASDIWDYMYLFPLNVIGKIVERVYLLFYRNMKIWTDAESTVEELENNGIKKNNCIVIHCPVTNDIASLPIIKEESPTYIFVSRLVKMKGIEEVIKAFGFILQEQTDAKLWIVGKGEKEYINRLQKMATEYGVAKKLTFYPNVSDTDKYMLMRKAHLLLHASVKEGWGLVVTEAASQGTPAVVYNVPGLRDSVLSDRTGVILSENSPREMAKQAMLLCNNKKKYKEFQKNCITWAKSLNKDVVTKKSLHLIESIRKS